MKKTTVVLSVATFTATCLWFLQFQTKKENKDDHDQRRRRPRPIHQFTSALAVVESSHLYQLLYSRILVLPQPSILSPFSFSSLVRITQSSLRAFLYATLYSFTGILNAQRIVSSFIHSSISSPLLNRSALLKSPHVQFTTSTEAQQLHLARAQGALQKNGYKVHMFVKMTATTGWDEHLQQNAIAEETMNRYNRPSPNRPTVETKNNITTSMSMSTPVQPARHMRLSSGLTWKCELCGERSTMSALECPICGTVRPVNPPQKGELEEATPVKTQEDVKKAAATRRRQRAVLEQARRRATVRSQKVETVSSSSSSSSSASSSSPSSSDASDVETSTSSSFSSKYAIVNLQLLCPKHVTSMDVGRLYGSIMTIFAALEQFSNGALAKCTVVPKLNDTDNRYEIFVTFAVLANVVDLSSISQTIEYITDLLQLNRIDLTTCINEDSWQSMLLDKDTLFEDLLAIDQVIDRLTIKGTNRVRHGNEHTAWSTVMRYVLGTIPGAIASEMFLYNLRWSRIPQCIRSLHELYNDLIRYGQLQASTSIVFNIIKKQWVTMQPSIDRIHSITVSSSTGSFGIDIE
jgi:hypothetical protein